MQWQQCIGWGTKLSSSGGHSFYGFSLYHAWMHGASECKQLESTSHFWTSSISWLLALWRNIAHPHRLDSEFPRFWNLFVSIAQITGLLAPTAKGRTGVSVLKVAKWTAKYFLPVRRKGLDSLAYKLSSSYSQTISHIYIYIYIYLYI